MSWLFWHLGYFLLDHFVWLIPVAFVAAAIFVPGFLGTLWTLSRTWLGGALIGALLGGIVLWEARAGLDHTGDMKGKLEAQQQATDKAESALKDARLQTAMLAKVSGDAARRAEAAEADDKADEEAAADLEDRFEAADRAAKGAARACKLTAGEAAAIDSIGVSRATTR